ncbi:MAG: GNAT family N-acetyltransferase, partial [Candidatus Bathyarchaeia archaeon]
MFRVKTLTREDFAFAVDLANTMDWKMAVEDFEFMTFLEPKGCFLLVDGSRRVGIATCISYGAVGWFGNLVVQEDCRGQGAGSLLVQHAITYLHAQGTQSIGLYCEPTLTKFYSNLGFKTDEEFVYFHGENDGAAKSAVLPKVERKHLPQIIGFDRQFVGGDRGKLLESIILEKDNLSYYVSDGKKVVGYIAATVYKNSAWVGPLICAPQRYDVALPLIETVLSNTKGKTVFAAFPKKDVRLSNALSGVKRGGGFELCRMFFGQSASKNCIYMAES